MIDTILLARLKPAIERRKRVRMAVSAAAVLLVLGIVALGLAAWRSSGGPVVPGLRGWLALAALVLTPVAALIASQASVDVRGIARRLEKRHPELEGRLLTAVEQQPDARGDFHFLQERVIEEAVRHSTEADWVDVVPRSGLVAARAALIVSAAFFAFSWFNHRPIAGSERPFGGAAAADDISVQPGDADVEKGSTVPVLVRFPGPLPAHVDLVRGESSSTESRVPLVKNLGDPIFGGVLSEVTESFSYRIDHDGVSTRTYRINVFEYPRLERSDVALTYPEYTRLAPKRIEDTRRISAVEGTRLDLDLQLNKPVASAVLQPRDEKQAAISLAPSPDKAAATLKGYLPAAGGSYELVLTDADGRQSKKAAPFTIEVLPNRVPELKLTSPKGDQKPSALQELTFDGTAWDDFGLVAYGLGLTGPDGQTQHIELGREAPGREKASFHHLVKFEDLKARPDDLFSWFVWADDIGPDGKVRRSSGDLFFGEIRPFEEIFRQGQGAESQSQEQQEQNGGQQGGNQATKLAQLQKQIINATWKIQRSAAAQDEAKTRADLKVVAESQEQARAQAEEAAQKATDPRSSGLWSAVQTAMDKAIAGLANVKDFSKDLPLVIADEQGAYQTLLKLRAREHELTQSRQQQRGQSGEGGGEQQERQQLNQMDLAKEENRYEQQRQAQAAQSAERREQMQVLNRLQELAKRQDEVNEKLKELQTALQEAKTEAEREEAKRQLKRLEEEQRQMLADADELKQRMEKPENQSKMEEQRQQLDQARENMQKAAEAAQEGQTGQALAAGTRAQRQMQEMRDRMRKEGSGQLAEDLRQMRAEARKLAQQQQEIAKDLKKDEQPGRRSLSDDDPSDKTQKAVEDQRQRTEDIVKKATALSEEAEAAEPLLSRQLYDAARQFSQADAGAVKELQQQMLREGELTERMFERMKEIQEAENAGRTQTLTREMLQQNNESGARQLAERAKSALDSLRDGVEKAAEKVLGDDAAALQFAEAQVRDAAEALEREMKAAEGQEAGSGEPREGQRGSAKDAKPGDQGRRPGSAVARADQGDPKPEESTESADAKEPQQPQDGSQPGEKPGGQSKQASAQSGQRGNPQKGGQQSGEAQGQEPRDPSEQATAQNEDRRPGEPEAGPPGQSERGKGQGKGQGQGGDPQSPQDGQQGGGAGNGQEIADANESPEGAERRQPGSPRPERGDRQRAGRRDGGGGSGPQSGLETAGPISAPLTGAGFAPWSDSLRDVEETLDSPTLRNEVATARERARNLRLEARKAGTKPDWAVVRLQIVKPLVEVRQRLREELARRDSDKALVPIDRDPVPARFSEAVERYYEQLGRDQ